MTELEGCVLGIVWSRGGCTPYSVRRVFLESPSPHWSGSAGAIYPLVRRLEARRLIRVGSRATGPRPGYRYVVTASGLKALRRWLGPPLQESAVGVPVDALRTRLQFLGAVAPARRAAFLAEARTKLRAHLRSVEADARRRLATGDPFAYLVGRGAVRMVRARLEWLREVQRALAAPRGSAGGAVTHLPQRRRSSAPASRSRATGPPSGGR